MFDPVPARKRTARLAYRVGVAAVVLVLVGLPMRTPARTSGPTTRPTPVTLGKKIFHDPSLSASGAMSCATCHDPSAGHAQSTSLAVQFGGRLLNAPGFRAVPSLRYLNATP